MLTTAPQRGTRVANLDSEASTTTFFIDRLIVHGEHPHNLVHRPDPAGDGAPPGSPAVAVLHIGQDHSGHDRLVLDVVTTARALDGDERWRPEGATLGERRADDRRPEAVTEATLSDYPVGTPLVTGARRRRPAAEGPDAFVSTPVSGDRSERALPRRSRWKLLSFQSPAAPTEPSVVTSLPVRQPRTRRPLAAIGPTPDVVLGLRHRGRRLAGAAVALAAITCVLLTVAIGMKPDRRPPGGVGPAETGATTTVDDSSSSTTRAVAAAPARELSAVTSPAAPQQPARVMICRDNASFPPGAKGCVPYNDPTSDVSPGLTDESLSP
jgi:hypothetical protein